MAASEFTAVVKYEPTTAQNPDPEQSAAPGSTVKGVAALGRPDVGLLTMTEMAGNAGRIAACVDIPVIADADYVTGVPDLARPGRRRL